MADRSIKVTLRANVTDFSRELAKATSDLDKLVKKSGDASGAANTTMGRLAQSARLQSESWQRVGTSLVGVGAAITGVNALVAKTGIEYNTLQQKSRAALSTMLGSAAEVNAQMDKLDAFARTSPFSKATFITAQQQMLAFGIEAEKVVPYLSAINEATAAAGGNSQTLSELSFVMAQISAAGKITAQDLMQFGQRGVNAAELIGSQMGKTGAQIREDITAGTLGAEDALDALAAGMQEKFAGASANVKDTMEGATDRLKAAWRDLASSFMESAVGPEGGGWLVDLTNKAADALRAIEKLPDGAKNAIAAVSGIGGVAALAGGGLLILAPAALDTYKAFKELNAVAPGLSGKIGGFARGATIAAVSVAALGSASRILTEETRPLGDLAAALERVAESGGNLASLDMSLPQRSFAGMEVSARNVGELFEKIRFYDSGSFGDNANKFFYGLMESVGFTESALTETRNTLGEIDAQLAAMDGKSAAAAFDSIAESAESAGMSTQELLAEFPTYAAMIREGLVAASDEWTTYSTSAETVAEVMRGNLPDGLVMTEQGLMSVAQAARDGASAIDSNASSGEALTQVLEQQAAAALRASEAVSSYYGTMLSLSGSAQSFEAAIDAATAAIAENGATHDIAEEAGRKNQSALDAIASSSMRVAEEMGKAGKSTSDIAGFSATAREEFVSTATQMGYTAEAANQLADDYGLIPELVSTLISQPGMKLSQEETDALIALLGRVPPEVQSRILTVADLSGYYNVNEVLNSISGRTVTTYVAIKQMGQAAIATGGGVDHAAEAIGLAGGGRPIRRRQPAGRVYGPGTPTSDSIVDVALSRDEFVHNAAARAYYGDDVMYAINARLIPREHFTALGFAGGGTPAHTYQPHRAVTATSPTLGSTVNTGDIHIHVQGGTSDEMLTDFARQLPGVIAGSPRRR